MKAYQQESEAAIKARHLRLCDGTEKIHDWLETRRATSGTQFGINAKSVEVPGDAEGDVVARRVLRFVRR
jgi:hypothetical protein